MPLPPAVHTAVPGDEWVVYDGKTGDELAAGANRDVVDLTLEEKMDDARRVAGALCAPATLA